MHRNMRCACALIAVAQVAARLAPRTTPLALPKTTSGRAAAKPLPERRAKTPALGARGGDSVVAKASEAELR